jgi:hypothetical protein
MTDYQHIGSLRIGSGPPAPPRAAGHVSHGRQMYLVANICVKYAAVILGGLASLVMLADWLTR